MVHVATKKILKGIDKFSKRLQTKKDIYSKLLKLVEKDKSKSKIMKISEPKLFKEIIHNFGAVLDAGKEQYDLSTVYDINIHKETGIWIYVKQGIVWLWGSSCGYLCRCYIYTKLSD